MGRIDLLIQLERERPSQRLNLRERRNQRLRTISSASSASIHNNLEVGSSSLGTDGDGPHYDLMDPQFYSAAAEDDADGFLDVVERLSREKNLTLAAIFDQVTPLKNTFLHVAAATGSSKIVEMIVDQHPSLAVNINSNGDTALHLAAQSGDAYIVKLIAELLKKDGKFGDHLPPPFRKQNKQGDTAVHVALKNAHDLVAFDLFMADPQVLYCLNQQGESPLYLAAKAGSVSCVRIMLKDLVTSEIPNKGLLKENSPFHAATKNRNLGR